MTSGQWDLNALEALEREALEVFDVLDVPEHIRPRSSPPHQHHSHTYHQHHHHHLNRPHSILTSTTNTDIMDIELESHIRNCPCNCNHMGYGNFMDYQVNIIVVFCFVWCFIIIRCFLFYYISFIQHFVPATKYFPSHISNRKWKRNITEKKVGTHFSFDMNMVFFKTRV